MAAQSEEFFLFIDPGISFDLYIFKKENDIIKLQRRIMVQVTTFKDCLKRSIDTITEYPKISKCVIVDNLCHEANDIIGELKKVNQNIEFKTITITNEIRENCVKQMDIENGSVLEKISLEWNNSQTIEQQKNSLYLFNREQLVKRLLTITLILFCPFNKTLIIISSYCYIHLCLFKI